MKRFALLTIPLVLIAVGLAFHFAAFRNRTPSDQVTRLRPEPPSNEARGEPDSQQSDTPAKTPEHAAPARSMPADQFPAALAVSVAPPAKTGALTAPAVSARPSITINSPTPAIKLSTEPARSETVSVYGSILRRIDDVRRTNQARQ